MLGRKVEINVNFTFYLSNLYLFVPWMSIASLKQILRGKMFARVATLAQMTFGQARISYGTQEMTSTVCIKDLDEFNLVNPYGGFCHYSSCLEMMLTLKWTKVT